jgi:hypothetical protein
MAKAKKAKIKKAKKAEQSKQQPLDDMRWKPVAEIAEKLLPHIGNKVLIARDLTEALASEKIRCMRRHTNEYPLKVKKLSDEEIYALLSKKTPREIDQPTGHRELVLASFWNAYCVACSPHGDIRVGFRLPPTHHGPSGPSFTWTGNWIFYLWLPDCVKVWPALTPQEIDARRAKPRPARKRSTRRPSLQDGTGSAIEAGDSAAASGSLNATKAGDTTTVAGMLKRKRRGKLTVEQIRVGRAYLLNHPKLKPKQAYPELRKVLNSDVSDTTLWRAFFRK